MITVFAVVAMAFIVDCVYIRQELKAINSSWWANDTARRQLNKERYL